MTDDDDDQGDASEQQLLALSGALQLQLIGILNDGGWSQAPHVAAHACSELLGQVLRAVVLRDPKKTPWTMDLIEHVRGFVMDATIRSDSDPGTVRH